MPVFHVLSYTLRLKCLSLFVGQLNCMAMFKKCFKKYQYGVTFAVAVSIGGCDAPRTQPIITGQHDGNERVESPYSVWVSSTLITAEELGNQLKQDPAYGDNLCREDTRRPATFDQHFAIISTHKSNRVDVIDNYQIDEAQPAVFGDSSLMLTPHVGDFLKQSGVVTLQDPVAHDVIKLTFSEKGMFTGYCDETNGYTSVINVLRNTNEMSVFSARCDRPATIVCMSIKG